MIIIDRARDLKRDFLIIKYTALVREDS